MDEVFRSRWFGECFTGTSNSDRVVSEEIVGLVGCRRSLLVPHTEKPK